MLPKARRRGCGERLFHTRGPAAATYDDRCAAGSYRGKATGFDKSNWPNMGDPAWGSTLYGYYGYKPYWD
jgi:hypothetical protein